MALSDLGRPRILFVSEAVTLAHLARPLALIEALAGEAYEVHLAVGDGFDSLVTQAPCIRHRIENLSHASFARRMWWGQQLFDTATLSRNVLEDEQLITAVQPDLIIGDFRLSLGVSARRCSVPYASVTNAYWSPAVLATYDVPSTIFTHVAPLPLAQGIFDRTQSLFFAHQVRPHNILRARYSLPLLPPSLSRLYTDADHVLYADIPEIYPECSFSPTEHFLGFLPWSLANPVPPDLFADTKESRPLCYVSLGSSGAPHVLSRLITGLGSLPVRVIVGSDGVPRDLSVPSNVKVMPPLSAAEMAEKADLLVTNGGSPMTGHAFSAGKPVLGIPANIDQLLNMSVVIRSGAGLSLRADRVTAQEVAGSAKRLLTEGSFQRAARHLQGCAARHDYRAAIKTFISQVTGVQSTNP